MTNRVAIGVLVALVACYVAATFVVDQPAVFLGKRFLDLIDWLAFWH